MSPCGGHVAVMRCPPDEPRRLQLVSLRPESVGRVLSQSDGLPDVVGQGVTSVQFSPCGAHVLLGYGVKDRPCPDPSDVNVRVCLAVFSNYAEDGKLVLVKTVAAPNFDVNMAMFHPVPGAGVVCGTRSGRVRVFGEFDDEALECYHHLSEYRHHRHHHDIANLPSLPLPLPLHVQRPPPAQQLPASTPSPVPLP